MSRKAEVVILKPPDAAQETKKRMQLDSGRQIIVDASEKEELIQIVEPKGEISMTIRMTENGPVITVRGAHLELKSAETITLEAKKIEMRAEQETVLTSKGSIDIKSTKKMDIGSDDDIRVKGKLIHLN